MTEEVSAGKIAQLQKDHQEVADKGVRLLEVVAKAALELVMVAPKLEEPLREHYRLQAKAMGMIADSINIILTKYEGLVGEILDCYGQDLEAHREFIEEIAKDLKLDLIKKKVGKKNKNVSS